MSNFSTFTPLSGQLLFVKAGSAVAVTPVKGESRTNIYVSATAFMAKDDEMFILQALDAIQK